MDNLKDISLSSLLPHVFFGEENDATEQTINHEVGNETTFQSLLLDLKDALFKMEGFMMVKVRDYRKFDFITCITNILIGITDYDNYTPENCEKINQHLVHIACLARMDENGYHTAATSLNPYRSVGKI